MSTPEFVRGMDVPPGTALPEGFELGDGVRRLASCVRSWPECSSSEYNPYCCRFPKSCSATSVPNRVYKAGDLEPAGESRADVVSAPEEIETGRRNLVAELKQMLRRKDLDEYPLDAQTVRDLVEVLENVRPTTKLVCTNCTATDFACTACGTRKEDGQ